MPVESIPSRNEVYMTSECQMIIKLHSKDGYFSSQIVYFSVSANGGG